MLYSILISASALAGLAFGADPDRFMDALDLRSSRRGGEPDLAALMGGLDGLLGGLEGPQGGDPLGALLGGLDLAGTNRGDRRQAPKAPQLTGDEKAVLTEHQKEARLALGMAYSVRANDHRLENHKFGVQVLKTSQDKEYAQFQKIEDGAGWKVNKATAAPLWFIALDGTTLYVVFRGSADAQDWKANFDAEPAQFGTVAEAIYGSDTAFLNLLDDSVTYHRGMLGRAVSALKAVADVLLDHSISEVKITGHSLGAGAAAASGSVLQRGALPSLKSAQVHVCGFSTPPFLIPTVDWTPETVAAYKSSVAAMKTAAMPVSENVTYIAVGGDIIVRFGALTHQILIAANGDQEVAQKMLKALQQVMNVFGGEGAPRKGRGHGQQAAQQDETASFQTAAMAGIQGYNGSVHEMFHSAAKNFVLAFGPNSSQQDFYPIQALLKQVGDAVRKGERVNPMALMMATMAPAPKGPSGDASAVLSLFPKEMGNLVGHHQVPAIERAYKNAGVTLQLQ